MKQVIFFFPLLLLLLGIGSCKQTCHCGLVCYHYSSPNITVCPTAAVTPTQYHNTVDSLNQIYGMGTGSFIDSLTVTATSTSAKNTVVSQLQNQGYACDCSY